MRGDGVGVGVGVGEGEGERRGNSTCSTWRNVGSRLLTYLLTYLLTCSTWRNVGSRCRSRRVRARSSCCFVSKKSKTSFACRVG